MVDHKLAELVTVTSDVVASYVARSRMSPAELIALIGGVHDAFLKIRKGGAPEPVKELIPAVPIRKSVTADYIICLEDGKPFKSLKRHLRTAYDLSPTEYRVKWGLPPDYPMVAESYAAQRSALAKAAGLGQSRSKAGIAKKAAKPAPRAKRQTKKAG